MKIKAYITHKLEENNSDCQDYFRINSEKRKIAISDGVSQSIFSAKWAQLLVTEYTDSDIMDISGELPRLQEKWLKFAQAELASLEKTGESTWMLENCLIERQGAAATFCGIKIDRDGKWTGYALGDSCLLEVAEDNKILNIYPAVQNGFGNSPDYFDSFTEGKGYISEISGKITLNQKLVLVTDPFGELLFNKKREGTEQNYVSKLLAVESYNDFLALVDSFRTVEKMHNDDSTLVIIENDGNESFDVEEMRLESLLANDKMQLQSTIYANEKELSEYANNIKPPKCCRRCKHKNNLLKMFRAYLKKYHM